MPLTDATMAKAQAADAVLLGAVGGPKYDALDFGLKPERGLLRLRKEMDLYANLRPAQCFDALADFSSLKREVVAGLDILIVRELTSGVYFGEPRGIVTEGNQRVGINTQRYTEGEIARVARSAFELARRRQNKVCSMEKANVMELGVLWRQVVTEVHDAEYPDVELSHMYADAGAMQLTRWPKQFDVIVTDNLFGDLLSDLAAMLTGSLGMLPSAEPRRADAERPAEGALRAGARLARPTSPGRRRPTRSPASSPSRWRCATRSTPATRRRASRRRSRRCSPTASAPPTCSARPAARRSPPPRWATRSSRPCNRLNSRTRVALHS